ncbi:acyltransferase family protein [Epilithonimonas hungarica]|uniref:Peptidoglycan/LPS O-acetylase OafA/YrhL, contains acyltransferase and SGNH-hydrolase domains n=1 Tax=Epilithonimonas hungarica TaxID=454006 RepID=A0A1G7GHA1_9FLAO|nr:acyltransferase family protein [Epilithonimonas hungarica]SDE87507.1 Peptidoglycan/LPS O-acetylase OafA/YrhL, contains acyltransferase and SGNH-hydrolase domains [Epilithonimonas hungarica]
MKFRTDISFLRAVSVLIVMLFHFQVKPFDGGFIGVDVFFVISGFLMTQIILKAFDSEKFSLKQFYIKRINRIIPPLQVLLIFILFVSVVFFFHTELKLNAKYTFLADFFVSNIYFWKYIDYFTSTDNILLHTWSLGVEWQFYLVYPLLLLFLKSYFGKKEKLFWGIVSFFSLLSLILMLYITKVDNNFAFYMLPSRFWELSIGGLAYLIGQNNRLGKLTKAILVASGFIAIALSSIFINEENLWPSHYTMIPVFGAVLILGMNIHTRFFDNKLAKFFGDISYSLYLWHWPWFILFKYFGFIGGYYTLILIVLSIVSAYLSFKFVEKNSSLSNIYFAATSSLIVAIIAVLLFINPSLVSGISIYQSKKFQIADYENTYINNGKEKQFNPCHCFITNSQKINDYSFKNCLKVSDKKQNILLIGDSHSAQFSSSLRKITNYNLLEASAGYVFPFPDSRGKKDTKELVDYVFKEFIPKNYKKIDLVIVSAHWLMKKNPNLNYKDSEIAEEVLKTIAFFNRYHINYIFLGQTENYKLSYPKILMLKNIGRSEDEFLDTESKSMNQILLRIVPKNHYIELYQNSMIKKYNEKNQIPYMFDGNHYSEYGAEQAVNKVLLPKINQILKEK